MVENLGFNDQFNKINITFPDCVIVDNISPLLIITFLGMIFSTITFSVDVTFI